MTLGERIRECRQGAHLSQEKVAELVGVSRQAVTKWETNQSAPNTENLFRLAEIFGTTVDLLLPMEESVKKSPAEEVYYLYKLEQEEKKVARRARWKKNALWALAVAWGFLLVFLLCKWIWDSGEAHTVIGWLTTSHSEGYLFGWLLARGLLRIVAIISVVAALLGRERMSLSIFCAATVGIPLGEWLGENPAGAAYGHGHYGWAIWLILVLGAAVLGGILEWLRKKGVAFRSRKTLWWCLVLLGVVGTLVACVVLSLPSQFS